MKPLILTITVGIALVISPGCSSSSRDASTVDDTATGPLCVNDCDQDGFTIDEGDCDDRDPRVGPDAVEWRGASSEGDGIDNDCDGLTDEVEQCECSPPLGNTVDAVDCATELACHRRYVVTPGVIYSSTSSYIDESFDAIERFGDYSNDLAPRGRLSYAHLSTGLANTDLHSTDLDTDTNTEGPKTDPFSNEGYLMHDAIDYEIELLAPMNAYGFAFDFVFFSAEYDDFVGTEKNDKFYAILNAPVTTGGEDRVINYTHCRNPIEHYDFGAGEGCALEGGFCCYIAINSALSDCCWYPPCPEDTERTNIEGTGYECADNEIQDNNAYGSSTGWLTTRWPIDPGEQFSLRFHLHDTHDSVYDSSVLLDNFRWLMSPVDIGTIPL